MRRIIPFMVIVTILLSMGLSAAATETTEFSGKVQAVYVPAAEREQIISVEIDWVGMDFTYNGASSSVWDPKEHKYTATPAGWAESDASITIINHSNVILQAAIEYIRDTGYDKMSMAFTQDAPYIGSAEVAEGTNAGKECEVIIRAVPMGEIPDTTSTNIKVGEIKLTVTPVENITTVVGTLGDIYDRLPVKSDGPGAGEVYYNTPDDITELTTLYNTAKGMAESSESPARKNEALNAFLTAFYGKLRVMPEVATS